MTVAGQSTPKRLKERTVKEKDFPQLLSALGDLIRTEARFQMRNWTYQGKSFEDVGSEMVVSLLSRQRFVLDQAPMVRRKMLPRCLRDEVRRRAAQIRSKARCSPLLVDVAGRPTPDIPECETVLAPVLERFLASLPPKGRQALEARADGARKSQIAATLQISERTLRGWWKRIRQDAVAWGIRPR
jgi:DNA-directed RNA polymerase specialized sigma24 family protein